jgi:hypothetical protein
MRGLLERSLLERFDLDIPLFHSRCEQQRILRVDGTREAFGTWTEGVP